MRKSYGPFKGVDDLLAVGYKIFDRCQECGIQGLTDRSRRPYRYANQLPFQVENYILNVKHEHPSPGARKIRERLIRWLLRGPARTDRNGDAPGFFVSP